MFRTHVGCEHRKLCVEVEPLAVPSNETVDGEGVPQIMRSWTLTLPSMGNCGGAKDLAKTRRRPYRLNTAWRWSR